MTYTFNGRRYEMAKAPNESLWLNTYNWKSDHFAFKEAERLWGSLEEAKIQAKHIIITDLKHRKEL